METFNFKFECCMCQGHRQRKAEALNCMFIEDITNKITSFLSCHQCVEMHECERDYQKLRYKNYTKTEKQINYIINTLNNQYNKLRTLKDKKAYLKDVVDKSESNMKPLMKKYINESHHIYTIDRLLGFLAVGKIDIFARFNPDLDQIIYYYRRQEEIIVEILKELMIVYLKHGMRFRQKYFNFDDIIKYVRYNISVNYAYGYTN